MAEGFDEAGVAGHVLPAVRCVFFSELHIVNPPFQSGPVGINSGEHIQYCTGQGTIFAPVCRYTLQAKNSLNQQLYLVTRLSDVLLI